MSFLSLDSLPPGNHLAIVHSESCGIYGDNVSFELCYGTIRKGKFDAALIIGDTVGPFYQPKDIVDAYERNQRINIWTNEYVNEFITIEDDKIIEKLMEYTRKVIVYFNVNNGEIKILKVLHQHCPYRQITWF